MLHIVEPVQVPWSVLTQFAELHRAETRGRSVVRQAPLDDAETLLFHPLCNRWEVHPGSVTLGYSSGSPTLSQRNVVKSRGVYGLILLKMLHKVTVGSSSNSKVLTWKQVERDELSCS